MSYALRSKVALCPPGQHHEDRHAAQSEESAVCFEFWGRSRSRTLRFRSLKSPNPKTKEPGTRQGNPGVNNKATVAAQAVAASRIVNGKRCHCWCRSRYRLRRCRYMYGLVFVRSRCLVLWPQETHVLASRAPRVGAVVRAASPSRESAPVWWCGSKAC